MGGASLYEGMEDDSRGLPCPRYDVRPAESRHDVVSSLDAGQGPIASPLFAALVAITIFTVDTVTTLDIAVAVLYVAVVLLALDFTRFEGILAVAAGCMLLTVLSFAISHGTEPILGSILRGLVSLAAITITALLAARNQRAVTALREQASLLDLTHDTIFVRDLQRRHHLLESRRRRALRLAPRGGDRPAVARSFCRRCSPRRRTAITAELGDRPLGGRAGPHHARRPAGHGGEPVVAAARRARPAGRDSRDQQRHHRRSAPSRTSCTARRPSWRMSRASTTLGELTASIAHEVNQPLAAIVTNGEAGLRWLGRAVPELGRGASDRRGA